MRQITTQVISRQIAETGSAYPIHLPKLNPVALPYSLTDKGVTSLIYVDSRVDEVEQDHVGECPTERCHSPAAG